MASGVMSSIQVHIYYMVSRDDVHVIIRDNIFKEQQTKSAIFLSESQTGQLVVRFRYIVGVHSA